MLLTFFAHSTTTDNEKHKATGWLQGELSTKGVQQATELPNLIKDNSFVVVYSSDLKRAIDSAKLGFGKTHNLRQDWRLREANYGDFDGQDKEFKQEMSNFIHNPYPNGESYTDVEQRIREFLQDAQNEFGEQHIAVIGHEATQLAIEVVALNKTWEQVIVENWRPQGKWQPGWQYVIN